MRVNANLKVGTVEDLIAKMKVGNLEFTPPLSILPEFLKLQGLHCASFSFNEKSQEFHFTEQLGMYLNNSSTRAILENIIMLECKETRNRHSGQRAKDFLDFDIYKSLALEMIEQISLTQIRGQAAIQTLEDLALGLESDGEQLRYQH